MPTSPPSTLPGREQKFVLANGVRVLLEPLPHVHSASIGFWVDVGSVQEGDGLSGACHFIEHMLFKGTPRRSALEIAQSLEVTGGSLNAFTDKENTCFYARVLASDVPLAIDVLADMLLNSAFDPAEIRREKAVIAEEIKMYDDTPDDLVHELLFGAMWESHPLGRPVTGTKASVRSLTRDGLLAFKERFYTPDRLVIAIAGHIDVERVLAQLAETVGQMKRPASASEDAPLPHRASTVVKYRDIEQVHLCMGTRGVGIGDPRRYTLALLNSILGGGMSSRLFQEVREKRGLVYSIHSYDALYRPGGLFAIAAGMSPKHLPTVLAVVRQELDKVMGGDLTDAELAQAKQQLRGGLLLSLEVPRNRMNRMAQNEIYYGRLVPPDEVLDAIDALALADLTALAQELFQREHFTTTVVGPLRKLPAAQPA